MSDLKAVKKHAAQHDLFNRIHSIASDEQFVRNVAERWFNNRFKVVAQTSSSVYAYFKSTDGHTLVGWHIGRILTCAELGLQLEKVKPAAGRMGREERWRMPDGLSKTVPIWCSVVNRAIALRRDLDDWDENIYLPAIVSPSERSQIEAKLDDWAEKLEGLKPALYHRHKKDLLSASRDELPPLVDNLVQDESVCAPLQALDLSEDSWARATQVDEAIALDLGKTTGKLAFEPPQVWVTVWVAEVRKPYSGPTIVPLSNGDAFFAVPCPRAEPKAYVVALRQLHSHVATSDRGVLLAPAMQGDLEGLPKPPTAKLDPAALSQARKVIIPVAVTLMCRDDSVVDKSVIADRLHRLVALWPDGNPPRAALKRVNDFFMSAGR
ncbi:hypothetical protein A1Q2_06410 [Trichosporon asahii var. asahii CBS 8904]|uniref:Uncharacterized protein n=1 Tax=Trichosporon asahii var. asahii (strain CBS 8904) TaxID=1220162 RepID=K1VED6_TRIAC|nr:hypothetical protein A1Q2_06410 [Trichosporon asahii var. asahii CBS 8904]